MKLLRFFDKPIFFFNILFALLLLFSYSLPYVIPRQYPLISVLSLTLPVFIVINFIFLLYWLLRWKRQFLLSFLTLLFGFTYIQAFYKFFAKKPPLVKTEDLVSIMTYNVRLFNAYQWIKDTSIDEAIITLIKKENPDILCIQEFYSENEKAFTHYPYQYIESKTTHQTNGQAIFSKFPIINSGSLAFPHTDNNAVYVDIVKEKDTIRVYNLHLESLKIQPEKETLTQENSKRLYKRIAHAFAIQQGQVEIFDAHRKTCSYKKIVCGDFNNTAYSRIYKQVRADMNDSFEEAGKGFGRTFHFAYFPLRIDFILTDKEIKTLAHQNYRQSYSDHFPVMALLRL